MQNCSRFPSGSNIRKWSRSRGIGLFLLSLVAISVIGCGASSQPAAVPAEAPAAQSPAAAPPTAGAASQPAQSSTQPAAPAQSRVESATEPPAEAMAQGEPATAPAATEPEPTAVPEAVSPSQPDSTDTPEPAPTVAPGAQPTGGAGFTVGEGSEATFTVNEKLAWLDLPNDAVMRTVGITGSIYLDGQPSVFELDLHSMTSDSDRRDGYVRNRMFPNDRVATFTVSDLGELPDPLPEGEVISREVAGELTIMGVTKPIVFDVEARQDPDKLFILGRTSFTWDELEIPPPNIPGRIAVQDEVKVEVLLSAVPEDN